MMGENIRVREMPGTETNANCRNQWQEMENFPRECPFNCLVGNIQLKEKDMKVD